MKDVSRLVCAVLSPLIFIFFLSIREAKSQKFSGRATEVRYSSNHARSSSFATSRLLASSAGRIYVINQNTLFRMQRDEGDMWERIAENVQTASFDPKNDDVIYRVDTDNLLSKSLNGGGKWISINNGLPRARMNVITVNPGNSDEVFAGTDMGLYRTTDGGFSWTPTVLRSVIAAYYVDHITPTNRYSLLGDGSVVVSRNNGETWTRSETGLPSELVRVRGKAPTRITAKVRNLFFVDQEKPYLLAIMYDNSLFRSDDNGASWKRSDAGLNKGIRYDSIYVEESEIVLAGDNLARSNDGSTWTIVPITTARFAPQIFTGITRKPKDEGFIVLFRYEQDPQEGGARIGYVTESGSLVGLNYGLLPRSTIISMFSGQYRGKQALFATVSNSTPTNQGSARDIKNGTYYVVSGTYNVDGGTYFSIDDGLSWEYLLSSECGTATTSRPSVPNELWMYGDGPCLFRLRGDNGFKAEGTQFQAANDSVSKVAFDPVDKGLLYYTAGVNENALYRYKYDLATNQGQTVNLNLATSDVVVCEDNPKYILAGVSKLSIDGGWTWLDKSSALKQYLTRSYGEGYRRGDLRLLPCRTNEFRVLVYHYDARLDSEAFWVMKSNNVGDSWEVASSYKGQLKRVFVNSDDSRNMFVVVQTFVKSGFSNRGDAIKVLETQDRGDNWREIYSYKLTKDDEYNENKLVNVVSQTTIANRRSLFIGGLIGLWRSDDEGRSWQRLGGIRQSAQTGAPSETKTFEREPIAIVKAPTTNPIDELLPLSKKLWAAIANGDRAAVDSLLSDDFVYRDVGNRKVMDRTKFLSSIKRFRGLNHDKCGDNRTSMEGNQALLTRLCEYDMSSLIFAQSLHVRQRVTDRFAKRNGTWTVVGVDTIVLPNR